MTGVNFFDLIEIAGFFGPRTKKHNGPAAVPPSRRLLSGLGSRESVTVEVFRFVEVTEPLLRHDLKELYSKTNRAV